MWRHSASRRTSGLPVTAPAESLRLLHDIMGSFDLRKQAANWFKECALSVDLDGREDGRIEKGASYMRWSQTTDGYANMRAKIKFELEVIETDHDYGCLTWGREALEALC